MTMVPYATRFTRTNLDSAHSKRIRALKNRPVKLDQGGAGVVVVGSGVRVHLELREGVDEAVEVPVCALTRLDSEVHSSLVLSAAERLVVHPRFLGVGVLERRARASRSGAGRWCQHFKNCSH